MLICITCQEPKFMHTYIYNHINKNENYIYYLSGKVLYVRRDYINSFMGM